MAGERSSEGAGRSGGLATRARKIETWVWVLIYAGLLLLGLGLAIARQDGALGWSVAAVGAAGVAMGLVLIWIRSRIDIS